ncbi:universal stress protein [Halorubrum sp. DTA98]|uniref:universal stress protein n=1 Tax=Halorubrum sp. DTA98 TaxID=3402163 RepID=UPI003AAF9446
MVVIAAVDRTDRAKNAVTEAVKLAEAFDEPVHVVHVLSQSDFVELERTEVKKSGRAVEMDRIREYGATVAEEAAEDVDQDVAIEYVGLVGDAADQILEYADNENARYVVVGPRKKTPAGKVLFGSVSQEVLLNADCPVLVSMSRT